MLVDGDLSEWDRRGPLVLDQGYQRNLDAATGLSQDWAGADDASAVLFFSYDHDHLYLGGEVRDDDRVYDDRVWWNGDCIELFLDVDRDGDRDQAEWNDDDYQLCFMPYNAGRAWGVARHGRSPLLSSGDLHGVKVACRPTVRAGYTFEVAIPFDDFKAFDRDSDRVGFNVALNDVDHREEGPARHSVLTLNGASRSHEDTRNLLDLVFVTGEGPLPRAVAEPEAPRFTPWILSLAIGLLLIALVAWSSHPVFEWVDGRLRSWRRVGLLILLLAAFFVFGVPQLVLWFREWRAEREFGQRALSVGRVIADLNDAIAVNEGRGLDEPERIIALLRGQRTPVRRAFDFTCFELRPAAEDPRLRTSPEGVPARDVGIDLEPTTSLALPLPEPLVLRRLYVFGSAVLEGGAAAAGGAASRPQVLEIGVRRVDGSVGIDLYPLTDGRNLRRLGAPPLSDRVRPAWQDGDRRIEQFFVGPQTLGETLTQAITLTVKDSAFRFRLHGVTYERADGTGGLETLCLARPSLAGPPAAVWDGAAADVALEVTRQKKQARVPIGRELDHLFFFYTTTDVAVLEPVRNGVEVGRITVLGRDQQPLAHVPLRAGVNLWYGLKDPDQRPATMQSAVAFRLTHGDGVPRCVELLEHPLAERVFVDSVVFEGHGSLETISLYGVTGGVKAARLAAIGSGALVEEDAALLVRPEVQADFADLDFAVFVDGKAAALHFNDPALVTALKGVPLPLGGGGGGGGDAGPDQAAQVELGGEHYLVRWFPLTGAGRKPLLFAALMHVKGVPSLRQLQIDVGLLSLLLVVPLALFYIVDRAIRIARLRLRMTTLLVATSLAPLAILFAVLFDVVDRDRARLRESRVLAGLQEVHARIAQRSEEIRRTAREILDSEVLRDTQRSGVLDGERIRNSLKQVVQLQPGGGIDVGVRLEVEVEGGQRLRFHDDPSGEGSSRFDLTKSGVHEHWDQLLVVWTEEWQGPRFAGRVTVAGAVLPSFVADVGQSTATTVSLLSLKGHPLAGSRPGDAAARSRAVAELRSPDRPAMRVDDSGRLVAADFLRGEEGDPVALVEAVMPPDTFLLELPFGEVRLASFFFWFCVLGLAGAVFLGSVATGRLTRPIESLEVAARRVARGDLDVEVETGERGEVGRLFDSFNSMTAELRRRAVERERLDRSMVQMTRAFDPEATAVAALAALCEEPDARSAALYRLDFDQEQLVRLARHGEGDDLYPTSLAPGPILHAALDSLEPAVLDPAAPPAVQGEPVVIERAWLSGGPMLLLPLPLSGQSTGLVAIRYAPPVGPRDVARALPFLQTLSGQIAVALENARLYQLAVADPQTGLYVESYFLNRLAEEVDRAQHRGVQLALVRIEVDDLARVQRLHGPQAARDVLVRVARLVKAESRDMYVVAVAGQAFLVLLPESGREAAEALAARVARRVDVLEERSATARTRLSAQCGIATFPADGESAAFLLDAAARDVASARRRKVREALASPPGEDSRVERDLEPYVFRSQAMRALLAQVERVANSSASVLLLGETGVGKEVLAELLHRWSDRGHQPFVAINCSALPEALLEAELFGYDRGAFTGAHRSKPGQIELAHRGTLFLDEIGDLPLALQSKLLRVLQDRMVTRLGGRRPFEADVRIVAATNRDLNAMIRAGSFRSDLYFRLKVVSLTVPPLRERREDIPALVELFVRQFNEEHGPPARELSTAALDRLHRHDWPGNVRELKNVVDRALLVTDGPLVLPAALELEEAGGVRAGGNGPAAGGPERVRPARDGDGAASPAARAASAEDGAALNERQRRLLGHLWEQETGRTILGREYFELVGIAARTGQRDLNDLVHRGLLERLGKRRAATYRLPADARSHAS